MAITFHHPDGSLKVENRADFTILQLAQDSGLPIDAKCGGKGSCGRCVVWLGCGNYEVCTQRVEVGTGQRREALACQCTVLGQDAEIYLPRSTLIATEGAGIISTFKLPATFNSSLQVTNGYGVAVDIGTTTVVAVLIKLDTGEIADCQSLYNQQILQADDVISRIALCADTGGLQTLQKLIIEKTLNPLIGRLCANSAINSNEITRLSLAGNTVMLHIFYGISPVSIGVLPFTPRQRSFTSNANKLGINILSSATVEAVPAISGFLGGDLTADIYVSELLQREGCTLLIDIGTNGEIALCDNARIFACATAAGPAFEGAGIMHGIRAVNGAIEAVSFNESLDFNISVIGDTAPRGLCGSAIIDFIAEGFRCGLINMMGRFNIELLQKRGCYTAVNGTHACVLFRATNSDNKIDIVITERDIAEILKAKAAIYGGIKTLLKEVGRTIHDLDQIILAGGFAAYINLLNAFELGLLPNIGVEHYEIIGNGSLAGAAALLLNQQLADEYRALIDKPQIIHLNSTDNFSEYFQDAIVIPNLVPES